MRHRGRGGDLFYNCGTNNELRCYWDLTAITWGFFIAHTARKRTEGRAVCPSRRTAGIDFWWRPNGMDLIFWFFPAYSPLVTENCRWTLPKIVISRPGLRFQMFAALIETECCDTAVSESSDYADVMAPSTAA